MTNYYDPDDPWSELLDPSVASQFRAALDATLAERLRPFHEAEADRKLKAEEDRARAIYGKKWYDEHRLTILRSALANNITDLDVAVRAWRGSQGMPVADAPDTSPEKASDKREDERPYEDRLLEADRLSRKRKAFHEEIEAAEAELEKTLRAANAEDNRKEQIRSINSQHNSRNAVRTMRAELGHPEEDAPARRETRDEMDLQVEEMIRAANESSD